MHKTRIKIESVTRSIHKKKIRPNVDPQLYINPNKTRLYYPYSNTTINGCIGLHTMQLRNRISNIKNMKKIHV